MKKQLLSLGIAAMIAGFSTNILAQDYVEKKITDTNGNVSLVVFKSSSDLTKTSAGNIFKEILNISSNDELKLVKSETDFTGKFVDEKYQLFHKNIKVENGVYNLHYQNGKLNSMNGEVFRNENTVSNPTLSASAAFDIAVKSVGAQKYMWEDAEYIAHNEYKKPTGELVYIPIVQENGKYTLVLAYKFDIYAAEPMSRDNIYVDAVQGKVVYSDAIMKHTDGHKHLGNLSAYAENYNPAAAVLFPTLVPGNADTKYSGTKIIETTLAASGKYILHDTTRGGGVHTYNLKKGTNYGSAVEFEDDDNNWTSAEFNNSNFDDAALDAHWGVEKTYDYFKTTFNRDSYNGNGSILKSYVHYGVNYENASWTGSEMRYGDGASMFKPLTAFDITAHELGHGVCQTTAGLQYQRESGALNEALSDIWGASVEYTYAPEKQTWLIGEDIAKTNPYFLRSMSNPKAGSPPQPDTYRGINWYPATIEEGCVSPNSNTNDNCGVHYNSGVINHWFYILSVGKTGTNDLGKSYSVTGIGIEKAAKIVYRLETNYLTGTSNFMAARNLGIQAAKDLYGENSPEAIATQDAFYAVGLGPKWLAIPDTTPPTVPLNLTASNTSSTATLLTWEPSTDDHDMEKYIIYRNGTEIGTAKATAVTYAATGLTPNTTYSFYVKAQDAYDNISSESNTVQITTLNKTHCTSTSTNTSIEKIKRVQFANIDNTSTSAAGYEDFSYISTDVEKGKTYPIRITPDWSGTHRAEGYAVYIDYNNDGDFDDAGETAFTKAATSSSLITGSIAIPTDIEGENSVRMRVVMAYNTIRTPCGNFMYGQVEDYTINLKNTLAVSDVNSSKTVLYPNPVKDVINVQSKASGEFSYKIFNTSGQLAANGTSMDKKINAQKLPAGNYVIELTDKAGNVSSVKFIKK